MPDDPPHPTMSLVTPLGHDYWRDKAGQIFRGRYLDRDLNVYRGQYLVRGADVATFEPLNYIWARDARRIYSQGSRLVADHDTFEVLNAIYARDRQFVYYLGGKAKWIDRDSFRVLDTGEVPDDPSSRDRLEHKGYARDRSAVYFHDMMFGKPRAIRRADPETFEVVDLAHSISRDEDFVFWEEGRIKGADPATLESLGGGYYRDRARVYYAERVLPEADRDSFTVVDARNHRAKDWRNTNETGMTESARRAWSLGLSEDPGPPR